MISCEACQGTGNAPYAGTCEECGGSGVVRGVFAQPAEPDPWAITADTLDRLEPLVAMHTGLRVKLLVVGFSDDAADALVVEAARVLTAQMELRARTTAAKREAELHIAARPFSMEERERALDKIRRAAER